MKKKRSYKDIPRETRRKQTRSLLAYHRSKGNTAQVSKLYKRLQQMPIGGVEPREQKAMIGHCGIWHVITSIPYTTPCCGVILLTESEVR